ncbi:MAG: MoaD/ThiS family protein [Acidobacteriaceae bacterium]
MSVRVLLPNAFQKHTNGTREIQSSAGNLPALITEIETTFPALKTHLRDESGQVRKFINFYVNEEDIRFLGNEQYAFQDGDEVLVIPSIAGGSWPDGQARFAHGPDRGVCHCCSYCGQEECVCGD